MMPPAPGPGAYALSLATPGFFILVLTLALFFLMLVVLVRMHPARKRGFEGYLDAAGVSLGFLVFAVTLTVVLALHDPYGNRTAWALYATAVTGYWLAFAIPIVTVGSSIQGRTRGAVRWMVPSVLVAVLMFFTLFGYYYLAAH
jgi:hypothetical protein